MAGREGVLTTRRGGKMVMVARHTGARRRRGFSRAAARHKVKITLLENSIFHFFPTCGAASRPKLRQGCTTNGGGQLRRKSGLRPTCGCQSVKLGKFCSTCSCRKWKKKGKNEKNVGCRKLAKTWEKDKKNNVLGFLMNYLVLILNPMGRSLVR